MCFFLNLIEENNFLPFFYLPPTSFSKSVVTFNQSINRLIYLRDDETKQLAAMMWRKKNKFKFVKYIKAFLWLLQKKDMQPNNIHQDWQFYCQVKVLPVCFALE